LFLRFLRFGFLAWGGPVAQIAMLRDELVVAERWIPPERFNRLLAVYQVLPGPEAHELCVYFGMLMGGRLGGLLAGLGFMLPGFVLMLAFSWLYQEVGMGGMILLRAFQGVQAAVIALILRATHRIAQHALSSSWLWSVALVVGAADLCHVPFWFALPTAGFGHVAARSGRRVVALLLLAAIVGAAGWQLANMAVHRESAAAAANQVGGVARAPLLDLFISGLKGGLLTFGGAYTVIPFLEKDVVERWHWLTVDTFLDGLALSGMLPAPLIIFSTFVGYVAGGLAGAMAITAGIFLPAFTFSLLLHRQLERLLDMPRVRALLDGVTAGVVGIIASTTIQLAPKAFHGAASIGLMGAALVVLYSWRGKAAVPLVIVGAAAGGWLTLG
jgi:chromate transporter